MSKAQRIIRGEDMRWFGKLKQEHFSGDGKRNAPNNRGDSLPEYPAALPVVPTTIEPTAPGGHPRPSA